MKHQWGLWLVIDFLCRQKPLLSALAQHDTLPITLRAGTETIAYPLHRRTHCQLAGPLILSTKWGLQTAAKIHLITKEQESSPMEHRSMTAPAAGLPPWLSLPTASWTLSKAKAEGKWAGPLKTFYFLSHGATTKIRQWWSREISFHSYHSSRSSSIFKSR